MTYTTYLENEITRLKNEKKILNHKLSVQLKENRALRLECNDLKEELKRSDHVKATLFDENEKLKNKIFNYYN